MGFRTAPTVALAKAEKKDAGGKGGKGGDKKDVAKVAKTGQKKDSDESGRSSEDKKVKKTKAEISAERKERRAKAQAHKKKLAKKKNNLWDILLRYQDFGVGKTLRRSIWPPEHQTFWTITRVTMRKMAPARGKAWGVFTWRGKPQKMERQVRGLLKREWTMYEPVPNAAPLVEQKPSASQLEGLRPIMQAVYGVERSKSIVPADRYGPLKVKTSWHELTEEERKPIPGLPVRAYTGFDLPPPPPPPPTDPKVLAKAEFVLNTAVEKNTIVNSGLWKPTEK